MEMTFQSQYTDCLFDDYHVYFNKFKKTWFRFQNNAYFSWLPIFTWLMVSLFVSLNYWWLIFFFF